MKSHREILHSIYINILIYYITLYYYIIIILYIYIYIYYILIRKIQHYYSS
jgi:hypothetical protein